MSHTHKHVAFYHTQTCRTNGEKWFISKSWDVFVEGADVAVLDRRACAVEIDVPVLEIPDRRACAGDLCSWREHPVIPGNSTSVLKRQDIFNVLRLVFAGMGTRETEHVMRLIPRARGGPMATEDAWVYKNLETKVGPAAEMGSATKLPLPFEKKQVEPGVQFLGTVMEKKRIKQMSDVFEQAFPGVYKKNLHLGGFRTKLVIPMGVLLKSVL